MIHKKYDTQPILLLSILGIIIGMFKMNAVMSISMALFGLASIVHIYFNKPKSNHNIAYYLMIALVAWMILSGIWSENHTYYWDRIRIKLPLLLCPMMALFLPNFSAYDFRRIAYALFALLFIASLIVLFDYVIHLEEYSSGLLRGEHLPVPFFNHIRFSLFYAVACIFGLGLYLYERNTWGLFFSIYFFVFVHILAVRSGIIATYIVFAISFLYFVFHSKKYFESIIMISCIGTAIFLSSQYIPSLRSKLAYMKYDWEQYRQNNVASYSDGERINSIMHGLSIAKRNMLMGVGEGDVEDEMKREIYGDHFPEADTYIKMPHNQFIWTFAANGLLGVLLFAGVFLANIYKSYKEHNLYLFLFTIIAIVSMLVEQTLEAQLGVAWFSIPFFIFNQITCPPVSAQ
ncbi:MAG: O-antigen ligase family protein [Bacteroidetes bacterium]|nr:O-antigen ligase family protein [Bacteroidota bacterium]